MSATLNESSRSPLDPRGAARPKAYEVMRQSPPNVVSASRVDDIARKLSETGDSLAIVTDGNGHVRGVITTSDIALRVCGERLPAEFTQAVNIMSSEFIRCDPSDDLDKVMQLMKEHHVCHVLVTTGRRHRLHGVVDLGGIARAADPESLRDLVIALLDGNDHAALPG